MARHCADETAGTVARLGRVAATIASSLMVSACAQSGALELPGLLASAQQQSTPAASTGTAEELRAATAYWAAEYAKKPTDLNAALSYAKNLKAMGQKKRALAVLQQASLFHSNKRELAAEYGRLALDLGQLTVAEKVLAAADDPANPDWRVISARGTALAKKGQYSKAIAFYERALPLSNNQASVLNNLALAHAMSGKAEKAENLLREAAASGRNNTKVRQNLALVLGLQGKYDEATQIASTALPNDKAAQNTAFVRKMVKLDPVPAPVPARSGIAVAQNLPDLKPTATDVAAAAQGWSTKVAVTAPATGR